MHVPGLVCGGPVGSNIHIGTLAFGSTMSFCVFEILAASITVWRSVQAVVGPNKIRTNTFSFLLFEQGILSFCFVAIFTTVAAILNFRTPNGFLERLLNAFSLPLTCLIIARFILHLREWDAQKLKGSQDKSVQDHTMTTFQAVGRAVNSVAEEFGDDPVIQARQVHEVVVEELDLEEFEIGTP
ncbi:hypothetical protein EWM64_g8861 [Hericium alpestre]|uniref:Uncharacterized protein n=1 Tax=Hericium alpestre TaxID=135208 RepID=A0A4Y9ZNZ4_9AGAM|nr:hypothetical protein EWM64_g8861 [Hericium alpestre]